MSTILIGLLAFLLAASGLLARASRSTKLRHAAFGKPEVIAALNNLISKDSTYHDEFDLFISWPINDSFLESIRQRALIIVRKFPGTDTYDINPEGAREIKKLIYEVENHT